MDKWDKRFIELAELVASWSSCYQENRQVGAVIVKDKRIMTTGYNGAPSGIESCKTKGKCLRRELDVPSGTKLELCYAVHAEQNAICQAAQHGHAIDGGTAYVTISPCLTCAKLLVNAGIKEVVYSGEYAFLDTVKDVFKQAGVKHRKFKGEKK